MKIVKVTYTVKAEFAQKNKENVEAFIRDVAKIKSPVIRYVAYVGEDGKTFTHIASYETEEAPKALFALESFQSFQKHRDDSGLEAAPRVETITLAAASSYQVF